MSTAKATSKMEEGFRKRLVEEMYEEREHSDEEISNIKDEALFNDKPSKSSKTVKNSCSKVFGIKVPKGLPDVRVEMFNIEDWKDTVRCHIPKVDENYKFQPKQLVQLLIGLSLGDNVWISGATGSGKSTLVEQVCARTNRPFIRINGRGDMESGAIFGQYVLEDGKTIWKDGACTEAVKEGMVYCQDEPTVLPPEIAMGYQWLLENNGKLMLTDKAGDTKDKLICPYSRFRFVCCDNTKGLGDESGAFAGTNVWNTATLDRFGTSIQLDYLAKKHEVAILKAKVDGITDKMADYMVQLANLVRTSYMQGNLSFTMSPRTLLSWGEKAMFYNSAKHSLEVAFYDKLPNDAEKLAVEEMYATVFAERFNK